VRACVHARCCCCCCGAGGGEGGGGGMSCEKSKNIIDPPPPRTHTHTQDEACKHTRAVVSTWRSADLTFIAGRLIGTSPGKLTYARARARVWW
jgi:hypothetical protein